MANIRRWPQINSPEDRKSEIEEIFFLCSSRQTFSSNDEKQRFFNTWTDYYFDQWPEQLYVFQSGSPASRAVCYLSGCLNSRAALDDLSRISSYSLFKDLFEKYPAHLHINCHPEHQGLGYGQELVSQYCEDLKKSNVRGVHIVTGKGERNIQFYKRAGFSEIACRSFKGSELVFMGLVLD